MVSKKKTIIIAILSSICIGILCSLFVYSLFSYNDAAERPELYGTYRMNPDNLDEAEYLALIPSTDDNENQMKYQWYNVDNDILAQGTGSIDENGFIILHENDNKIADIFYNDEKFYFLDSSLEINEIIHISDEPMVCQPVD